MIGETSIVEKPAVAEEAFDTEYLIAKFGSTDDKIKKAVSATADALIGVVQGKAKKDAQVNVMILGVSLVKAGGAITRGNTLTSDANGKAIATTTAKNYLIGIAMASGADGDLIPVLLSQTVL